jgi:hypothetical protein
MKPITSKDIDEAMIMGLLSCPEDPEIRSYLRSERARRISDHLRAIQRAGNSITIHELTKWAAGTFPSIWRTSAPRSPRWRLGPPMGEPMRSCSHG